MKDLVFGFAGSSPEILKIESEEMGFRGVLRDLVIIDFFVLARVGFASLVRFLFTYSNHLPLASPPKTAFLVWNLISA